MSYASSIYRLGLCFVLSGLLSSTAADFSSWNNRARLDVTGYDHVETLTNFPLLVVFSNSAAFSYSQFLSGTNEELRFTDATQTNELAFEIEKWNTNGASQVWVQLPELAPGATTLYAFWGKAGETLPPGATNGAAWDATHLGVWHMAQASGLDSTSNRFNGTAVGTVTPVAAGKIDGANDFDADVDYIQIPDSARFTLTNAYTASAWIKPDALADYQGILGTYTGGTAGFIFTLNNTTNNWLMFWAAGQWRTNTVGVQDGAWTHVAYSRAGSAGTFYINGKVSGTVTNAVSGGDGGALHIGAGGALWSAQRFDGSLDEVRLCETARSPDWMWASWANQVSNSAFITVTPLTNLVRLAAATVVSNTSATLNGELLASAEAFSTVRAHWGTNDAQSGEWAFSELLAETLEAGPLSLRVNDLLPNQVYYFTFSATQSIGSFRGSPSGAFKTLGQPQVDSQPGATSIAYTVATLQGTLLDGAGAFVSADWGEAPDALSNRTEAVWSGEGLFGLPLAGLAADTAYFYRCFASNDYGTAWADTVAAFTTRVSTLLWTGGGSNALASNPTNWSTGLAPIDGANILLNETNTKSLTWDLTNVVLQSWEQTAGYTGLVTIATKYPGPGAFSNLLILGSCVINGGSWTHPANTGVDVAKDRLSVIVDGDFTLGSNGTINLVGRGFAASRGPGAGNAIQRSSNFGKGASHGGHGGFGASILPSPCYGSPLAPELPGSGASTTGGGALRLFAGGTATLNGTVLANGSLGASSQYAGASGGSIFIRAGLIEGAGLLDASGGLGYWSGGGGRVALIATNGATLGSVACRALPGGLPNLATARGAAGTLYKETAAEGPGRGRLIVDSQGLAPMAGAFTELPPSYESYSPHPAIGGELENILLQLTNTGSRVRLSSSLRIEAIDWIASGSTLDLGGFTLFNKAAEPPLPFPQSYGNGSIATNGGRILWDDEAATARVTATNGPNGTTTQSPATENDYYPFGEPVLLTAIPDPGFAFLWWEGTLPAGSNRTSNPLLITVDRTVDLRALFATNDAACRTWTGDGATTLASNPTNWFPVAVPVTGNRIIFNATSVKNCSWDLDIEPAAWRQEEGYADSYSPLDGYKGWVTLRTRYPGQGTFTNLTVTGDIVLNDGIWTHLANNTSEVERLAVRAGGDFTLGAGAIINVSGCGYAAGRGPGAGYSVQRSGTGYGASHGGRGGTGSTNGPAFCYGSALAPTTLGSGAVQAGGGTVQLAVQGAALIAGTITAEPGIGNSQGAGAAGGSIRITAASVGGQGLLTAAGVSGYQSGGGGRIALVLTGSDDFGSLDLRAHGGTGSSPPYNLAAAGTIYKETPSGRMLLVDNRGYAVTSTNTYAELPASLGAPADDLTQAILVITNQGRLALTDHQVMQDLFVYTNTLLFLQGRDLRLRNAFHADWGAPARVVYDEGRILWPATGTVILIR